MLKRVHNPFKQIRQTTRHIIKEKKLVVCLRWSFIFFLSFFLLLTHFSLNVKIEEQNSGRRSRSTQHADL